MSWKDTKITFFNYFPYDCAAVEEYLERMAAKGWLLQSINRNFFKFKGIEPKKIKYTVDTLSKVSVFDVKDSDVAVEYREYCERAGWNYVCENGKTEVFCTEDDKKVRPIHTDAGEKFKEVFKSSLLYVICQLVVAFMCIFIIKNTIFSGNTEHLLASNLLIILGMLMMFFLILVVIQITSFLIWAIKARHQTVKNKFMPYNTYRQLRVRNILTNGCILVYMFIFLRYLILTTTNKWQFALLIFIIIFSVVVMIYVNSVIEKKALIGKTNEAIIILSTIAFVVFIVFLIANIIRPSVTTGNEESIQRENASLLLSDFGYKQDKSANINFDKSILATRTMCSDENSNHTLSYTVFQSKYSWVMDIQKKERLRRFNNLGIHKIQHSVNIPSNIEVFAYDDKKSFILVSKDKIVDINRSFYYTSDQEFLDKVYKKLF